MHILPATTSDIPSIVSMVNAAYRGEASMQGWTTEAHIIAGDKRTDEGLLLSLLSQPGSVVLKLESDEGQLLGSVYLNHTAEGLYLGMLSVWPHLQAKGAGKMLMQAAEIHARHLGVSRIYMTVISRRAELIAWYQRRGYQFTGEIKPFEVDPEFGQPAMPLEFVVLEKFI